MTRLEFCSVLAATLLAFVAGTSIAMGETCTFPSGAQTWGTGDDVTALTPGAFTGCTPDTSDFYVASGTGGSATQITVAGHLDFAAAASHICIKGDSTLTLDVVAQDRALRLTLPSGATGVCATAAADEGLALEASGVLTLQGGYIEWGDATPVLLNDPSATDFATVGLVIPCLDEDCTTNDDFERWQWTDARDNAAEGAPGDTFLDEYLTEAGTWLGAGERLMACVFDPDETDPAGPVDQNNCYMVTAVDSTGPTYSLDIDLTQRLVAYSDYWDDTHRDVLSVTMSSSVAKGQRWIEVPHLTVDSQLTYAGRWLRFEKGATPQDRSYMISATEEGTCVATTSVHCTVDEQCESYLLTDTCDQTGTDWIQLLDTRGAFEAFNQASANENEIWIDYGHMRGDPFFLMVPVEITAAAEVEWAVEDVGIAASNGTLDFNGVLAHAMTTLGAHPTTGEAVTVAGWDNVAAWEMDGANAILLRGQVSENQITVTGNVIGRTMIVGALTSDDEANFCTGIDTPHDCCTGVGTGSCFGPSHGSLLMFDEQPVVRNWSIRYRGDDLVNYGASGYDAPVTDIHATVGPILHFERVDGRWMAPALAGGGRSGNYIANAGGGEVQLKTKSVLHDGVCVACSSCDGNGGLVGSRTGAALPYDGAWWDGVAVVANHCGMDAGWTSRFTNLLVVGTRAFKNNIWPGWPEAAGNLFDSPSSYRNFVMRDGATDADVIDSAAAANDFCYNTTAETTASSELCNDDTDCTTSGETCDGQGGTHFQSGIIRDNTYGNVGVSNARCSSASTLPCSGVMQDVPTATGAQWENILWLDNYGNHPTTHVHEQGSFCNVGNWNLEESTFAFSPTTIAAPQLDGFVRYSDTQTACNQTAWRGLLFANLAVGDAFQLNESVAERSGADSPYAVGSNFCYSNNLLDTSPTHDPQTGNLRQKRDRSPGFIDEAAGRYDTAAGSWADQNTCGIRRGAAAPGNCEYKWMHAMLRTEPECMADLERVTIPRRAAP